MLKVCGLKLQSLDTSKYFETLRFKPILRAQMLERAKRRMRAERGWNEAE